MKSAVKLHPCMYNLLIKDDLREFSAAHLKDALLDMTDEYTHAGEARKFIYRQLLRLEALGLISKTETGSGRSRALYAKTDHFYSTTFIPGKIPRNSRLNTLTAHASPDVSGEDAFLNDIKKEKIIHEAGLAVVLSEIEEYQSLMARFPSRKRYLMELYHQAKGQSAALLGKVTALSKILGQNNGGHRTC